METVNQTITLSTIQTTYNRACYLEASTAAEHIAEYEKFLIDLPVIQNLISALPKTRLLVILGGMSPTLAYRYKNEKKERAIQSILNNLQEAWNIEPSVSYSPMEETYSNAISRQVRKISEERYQEKKAEWEAKNAAFQKAISDPQTREEFETFVHQKGESALSPEQKERYQQLNAEYRREREDAMAAAKMTDHPKVIDKMQGEASSVDLQVQKVYHEKRGADMFVVTLGDRVDSQAFNDLRSTAKKLGGWYSRGWKGNPGGFYFEREEDADQLVVLQTTHVEVGPKDNHQGENSAVTKLKKMAQKMRDKAEASLNADRRRNTARQNQMAESAMRDARKLLSFAQTVSNVADALDGGSVVYLGKISDRTQLEALDSALREGQRRRLDADKNLTYSDREEARRHPYKVEDVDYATCPAPCIHAEEWISFLQTIKDMPGLKALSVRLRKYNVENSQHLHTLGLESAKMIQSRWSHPTQRVPWQIVDRIPVASRLARMGVVDDATIRAALREYLILKEGPVEKSTKEKIESQIAALVGMNVGIDFHNTPTALADRMAQDLDVDPGMTVLEPSAGVGHLADAVREVCPTSCITTNEISHTLREILVLKGYTPEAFDFMDFPGEPLYDRVIMNPPFSKKSPVGWQDIAHVRRAYQLLKPGGRLVAISSIGPFQRGDTQSIEFKEWVEANGLWEPLDPGMFNDSSVINKTSVGTAYIILHK